MGLHECPRDAFVRSPEACSTVDARSRRRYVQRLILGGFRWTWLLTPMRAALLLPVGFGADPRLGSGRVVRSRGPPNLRWTSRSLQEEIRARSNPASGGAEGRLQGSGLAHPSHPASHTHQTLGMCLMFTGFWRRTPAGDLRTEESRRAPGDRQETGGGSPPR